MAARDDERSPADAEFPLPMVVSSGEEAEEAEAHRPREQRSHAAHAPMDSHMANNEEPLEPHSPEDYEVDDSVSEEAHRFREPTVESLQQQIYAAHKATQSVSEASTIEPPTKNCHGYLGVAPPPRMSR